MKVPRLGAAQGRLLRGYGPLVVLIAAFLLMVLLVPTVARERIFTGNRNDPGSVIPGIGPGAESTTGGPNGLVSLGTVPGLSATQRLRQVAACTDRSAQVPGDPYSPPCIAFGGDNGGSTTRGVTRDTIKISARHTKDAALQSVLAEIGGAKITDSPDELVRTEIRMADYFNAHFQFYGRKLRVVDYPGSGSLTTELTGSGQDQANADAIRVANEEKSFADITAYTPSYADALTRQQVMSFGELYFSAPWFQARHPYGWSYFSDCNSIHQLFADYLNKRVFSRPARWAGGDLAGKPRTIALVLPDNPEYAPCLQLSDSMVRAAGNAYTTKLVYDLDIPTLSSQAASMISKLKSLNVTTVALATDPITPVYLTAKAHEQNYFPEWVTPGIGFVNYDLFAQLYDPAEWAHAFGTTLEGVQVPRRASFGYAAYKSLYPDEPAQLVDAVYNQMYLLALGIQMAGPDLTPASFERGMVAYPGGSGPGGKWKFGPGLYSPQRDGEAMWWDANSPSEVWGNTGTWRTDGHRWPLGQATPGEPRPGP
ncbi:MAG: hypothetical protein ABR598_03815 [Candidatus Dormibacteria bacterium]